MLVAFFVWSYCAVRPCFPSCPNWNTPACELGCSSFTQILQFFLLAEKMLSGGLAFFT